MLGKYEVIACVGTNQPERAKAFYRDVLGLELIEDAWWAIVFDVAGRRLNIEKAQKKFTPVPFHVALGWRVPNIEELVDALAKRGVIFERPSELELELDNKGIWTTPDGVLKVCWFRDPDGNLLSLSQFL